MTSVALRTAFCAGAVQAAGLRQVAAGVSASAGCDAKDASRVNAKLAERKMFLLSMSTSCSICVGYRNESGWRTSTLHQACIMHRRDASFLLQCAYPPGESLSLRASGSHDPRQSKPQRSFVPLRRRDLFLKRQRALARHAAWLAGTSCWLAG